MLSDAVSEHLFLKFSLVYPQPPQHFFASSASAFIFKYYVTVCLLVNRNLLEGTKFVNINAELNFVDQFT